MADCRDCQKPIEFAREDGRWVPRNPDGTEHYLTCTSDRAREMRVRRGQEPGVFPVDPSRIKTYIDCPAAYKRRYIDRIPDEKGPAALLGIAIHEYAEARLQGLEPPLPVVPLEMATDWGIMRDTFERQMEAGLWRLKDAAIEDRLKWSWQEGAMTVEMQVVIDWWQFNAGYPLVTDIKSGWGVAHDDGALFKISTPAELKKSVQGKANVLVVSKQGFDVTGGRFQEVHLRFGGEVIAADYSLDELDAFEEVLRGQVARMLRDTEYVPNPFCNVCPVGAHPTVSYPIAIAEGGEIVLQPPRTPEEALRLAEYTHAARRVAAAGTDALNPWCKANGPVGTFAHVEHVSRRVAPYVLRQPTEEGGEPIRVAGVEEVIAILREQGWERLLPELVVVNGAKLSSVLNSKGKYVSLAAALEPHLMEERKTKFEERREAVDPAEPSPVEQAPTGAAPQLSLLEGGS